MVKEFAYAAAVIALLAGLVYYAGPSRVLSAIANANFVLVAAALAAGLFSIAVRIMKWSVLVGVSFKMLAPVQIAGVMISNLSPGKVAEPVKSVLLKMRTGIAVSQSLPSVFWERVLDLTVVIAMASFAFAFIPMGGKLQLLGFAGVGIFAALVILILSVVYSRAFGTRIFSFARRLPLLNRIRENFIENFYSIKIAKRQLLLSLFFTIAAWTADAVSFYIAFLALGMVAPGILVLAGVMTLSVLIAIASSLPGGIGSFEVIAALLLGVIGVGEASAVSAVLLFRFTTLWFSIFLGALSLAYLGRKIDVRGALRAAG